MKRKLSEREKSFLKLLNASPTINSGATFGDNDGVMYYQVGDYDKLSVEVKCTDNKSFPLKKETWDKTEKEARRIDRMPLMAIDVQGTRLVVMSANDFMSIISYLEAIHYHSDNDIEKL
jgi:hypothetical protein